MFSQLAFNNLYSGASANDPCTLFSDCTLVSRKNVGSEVKARVSACKQVLMLEVESRLIASAMEELAINCIDDLPDESVLPSTLKNATKKEKKAFLEKISTAVVDNYVLRKEKIDQLPQKTRNAQNYESRERGMSNDGRFKCHFPGCCKTY